MTQQGDQLPFSPPPATSTAQLEAFILANGSRLLAYIREVFPASLKARYDPIDIYQTTVFEAFRRAHSFRHINDSATLGWLYVMARRQIGMTLRRHRREEARRGTEGAASGLAIKLLEEYAVYRRTPSQSAMRQELLIALEQALASLPQHLAEAVRFRHLNGLSMAETAERIGRTERAAATLCYRGLRLLQRKLRVYSYDS